ncbi:hypothetical protein G6O67_002922 [Ophiocordyceps sinensis]|uniref:Uncharacterized protein n=1 Tax=Ophiocordyceps sinensis TaxID=72228 RepID=A0A8H4PV98_9HYPO|nr:hypothetical protein G6O67_002922 [Ophiocordyceps sinensis]
MNDSSLFEIAKLMQDMSGQGILKSTGMEGRAKQTLTFWFLGSNASTCIPAHPRLFLMEHLCFSPADASNICFDCGPGQSAELPRPHGVCLATCKCKGVVNVGGGDVIAQVPDVDEAVLLGGRDELTGHLGLVAVEVNDGNGGDYGTIRSHVWI